MWIKLAKSVYIVSFSGPAHISNVYSVGIITVLKTINFLFQKCLYVVSLIVLCSIQHVRVNILKLEMYDI